MPCVVLAADIFLHQNPAKGCIAAIICLYHRHDRPEFRPKRQTQILTLDPCAAAACALRTGLSRTNGGRADGSDHRFGSDTHISDSRARGDGQWLFQFQCQRHQPLFSDAAGGGRSAGRGLRHPLLSGHYAGRAGDCRYTPQFFCASCRSGCRLLRYIQGWRVGLAPHSGHHSA